MLSRSGLYALQATLLLAQHPREQPLSAARMAEALEVPPEYLAKVLRRLGREGILVSSRGARGGYRLVRPPEQLSVAAVVRAFEDVALPKVCLLGGPCDAANPCTAHLRRLEWNDTRERLLAATTLAELLPANDGARRVAKLLAIPT